MTGACFVQKFVRILGKLAPTLAGFALATGLAAEESQAAPIRAALRAVNGVEVRIVTVDLRDPATVLTLVLANGAREPNSATMNHGAEPFGSMVARTRAAVVMNGTFFSKDAQRRVMGNVVHDGEIVKFSQWENAGTTFGLLPGNRPEMLTVRAGDQPSWSRYWLSLTAGPRLVAGGVTSVQPRAEGFRDPHVLGVAGRHALGFDRDGKELYLVSFRQNVSLPRAAEVMRSLGAFEAMNLDGGASRALAIGGRVVVTAGRELTNAIVVYDGKFPAPATLKGRWSGFGAKQEPVESEPDDAELDRDLAEDETPNLGDLSFSKPESTDGEQTATQINAVSPGAN